MATARPNVRRSVYDAIVDLTATGKRATRELIAEATSLKMTLVDDTLKRVVGDGQAVRLERGVFAPAPEQREDRAISYTILPTGLRKLEIGDHVIELTAREARHIGEATSGSVLQFGAMR